MVADGETAPPGLLPDPAGPRVDSRVGRGWIVAFSLAWFGFWAANLVPLQLLIPQQLAEVDSASKVRDFAVINLVSAVVVLVALPVFGALSDRSRIGFGRRRAFIGAGAVLFAVGLVVTGGQTTWGGIAGWWSFSQLGLAAMTAGLTAVIADRVPEGQRGMISSAVFGPQALGVVAGIAVVSVFGLTSFEGYLAVAGILLVVSLPFLRTYREVPPDGTPVLSLHDVVASMRIDVRRDPDFAWAFGGRLLVNLGNSLGTCYFLYFLSDELRVADPDSALLELTSVYLVSGIVLTYVAGHLSDRSGRRRVFVAVAAALQAVAGLMLAGFPSFAVAVVAAGIMGGGFGAYMAVDQALVTQVLPAGDSRAKDLGIMNIGTILPPAVAPAIAAVFITSWGGYPAMFGAVAVATAVGAVLVYRIRSVR